jgi:hypothetical protein
VDIPGRTGRPPHLAWHNERVTGWGVVIAFLLTPLGCWALLARTKVLGWTFAVVFAAYAVTEWILAPGWMFGFRFSGERLWLVPGLAVMSVVALVVGTQLENRDLDVPRRHSTRRGTVGLIVSSLYGVAVAIAVLLLAVALTVPS